MGLHVHPWNAKWLISVDASRPFNRILKSLYQITEQMPLFSWKRHFVEQRNVFSL